MIQERDTLRRWSVTEGKSEREKEREKKVRHEGMGGGGNKKKSKINQVGRERETEQGRG